MFRDYLARSFEFDLDFWANGRPKMDMLELEWDLAEWENERLLAAWEDELDAWIDERGREGSCPADPQYRPWPYRPFSRRRMPGDITLDEFIVELGDIEGDSAA